MKELIATIFPWVLAVIAVGIICVGMNRSVSQVNAKKMERYIAFGTGVGLLAAIILNLCGIWEGAMSLTDGALCGMAIATITGCRQDREGGKDVKNKKSDKTIRR